VLERRAAPALGAVVADPAQVEQVLLNVVVNARDAMPQGGTVVIETADVTVDDAFARLHDPMPAGAYVRLMVRDTGIGMDPTTMARAFDPFFTTKPLGHGTGMGLPTVYGIVKQSGGYIWLESMPAEGTTINIYLPRSADSARVVASRPRPLELHRGSETILIAEDEHLVRAVTRRTLERAGYRVHEAADGAEALAAARWGDLDLLRPASAMPSWAAWVGRRLRWGIRRSASSSCPATRTSARRT
jgi:CheY-like chemotaxis protein